MGVLIARDYCVSSKRAYTTGTFYASLQGTLQTNPAAGNAAQSQVSAGQLRNLRVRVVKSGQAGETSSVTLLKNGQATALFVDILDSQSNDGTTKENTSETVTFTQGDTLGWRIIAKADTSRELSLRWISARVEDP